MKRKYFISMFHYKDAKRVAKHMGLTPTEFVFVPYEGKERFVRLAGHHNIPKENLIGWFSSEETFNLTRD